MIVYTQFPVKRVPKPIGFAPLSKFNGYPGAIYFQIQYCECVSEQATFVTNKNGVGTMVNRNGGAMLFEPSFLFLQQLQLPGPPEQLQSDRPSTRII